MRSRVRAVVSSSNEMGAFESGAVAKYFGPLASVVSGGIGCILIVLSVMTLWPPAPPELAAIGLAGRSDDLTQMLFRLTARVDVSDSDFEICCKTRWFKKPRDYGSIAG
jgi:xanthosine utilization system XapX-like protein